jgi:hypothetical protein
MSKGSLRCRLAMQRPLLCLLSIAALACGCAKQSRTSDPHHDHGHGHGHGGETNLLPAEQPCPGPSGPITVRVLDSPTLSQDDPIAFVREPEIHWIVSLAVVEVVKGDFSGERLGVLVHSPSMFAGDVWGFGSSPQEHPAKLELRWTEEYCLFEVVGIETPEPEIDPSQPFEFKAPQVHSGMVG